MYTPKHAVVALIILVGIAVHCQAKTLTWTWTVPTTTANGTPLSDLQGYRLYQGTQPGTYGQIAEVPKDVTRYEQEVAQTNILQTLYSMVTAVDAKGNESKPSNIVVSQVAQLPTVPPVQGETVDVRAYGAIPDDGAHDTVAVRDAVEAVNNAGGGTVYFPPGTWDIYRLPLTTIAAPDMGAEPLSQPLKNVTLRGNPGGVSILKRRPYSKPDIDQRQLMTVQQAENVMLLDLALDMNGIAKFGGVAFHSSRNITILRTHVYDSNPQPYDMHGDIYAYVFGFGGTGHANLVFEDNIIDTLGVEIDHIDGAWINGNTFKNCRSTTCVGTFALHSDHVARNLHYVNNQIINPRKAGILVGYDFPAADPVHRSTFEQIFIRNNSIHYTEGVTTTAIRLGVGNNSIATSGNSMRTIYVDGNRIYVDGAMPMSPVSLLFVNNSGVAKVHFDTWHVKHNQLHSPTERLFVELKAGADASNMQVYDNVRMGASVQAVKLTGLRVNTSEHDGNRPSNTLDGKLYTRWAALGKGQWLRYDLGSQQTVSEVRIAWYVGTSRKSTFAIETSLNGVTWTPVHSGQSSGATDDFESYLFPPMAARYVRIVGQGNTQNDWNSITEVEVWGK